MSEGSWFDAPVDDGNEKPLGHQSPDGELEVRQQPEGGKCYHETDLGQHQRWMRQAPDLFALYMALVEEVNALRAQRSGEA